MSNLLDFRPPLQDDTEISRGISGISSDESSLSSQTSETYSSSTSSRDSSSSEDSTSLPTTESFSVEGQQNPTSQSTPEIQATSVGSSEAASAAAKPEQPKPIIENETGDWNKDSGLTNKAYGQKATKIIANKQKMSEQERKHIEEGRDEWYYWNYRNNFVSSGDVNLIKNSQQLKDDAKVYKMIKDHTVKLSTPCSAGTGWFLDFELPTSQDKYPTKWFIATNLHVINEIKFSESDNDYKVSLPVTKDTLDFYVNKNEKYKWCMEFLKKDSPSIDLLVEEDVTEELNRSDTQSVRYRSREQEYYKNHPVYIQMNENAGKGVNVRAPKIYETNIKNPKLVYAAINFAGVKKDFDDERKTMDYFKDFGIVEVNFDNEEVAKKVTNKLFDKYYKNKVFEGSNTQTSEKSVNFFASELMSRYDVDQINDSEEHFFVGGYPTGDNRSGEISFSMNQKYRKRYDSNYRASINPTHSKLTYFKEINDKENWTGYNFTNEHDQVVKGHMNTEKNKNHFKTTKLLWNNKSLHTWGYSYLIDNTFLGGGASGSMVLDKDGGLLGLYTRYDGKGFNYAEIEAVRGNQIKDKNGRVLVPSFDLIAGKGGGLYSYRTQLETHKKDMKTYLSSKANWKYS
ncbi:hypothetical protein MSUIS_07390 [Mycoplasma suis KI3806]|uniref:DUF31 domain-containing protein n=1 Tax=Mycoplasma suis (strain KI_3806) TaxID=708248 RepID=F0V2F1_MYCS3|nr:hypothetical protein [Mycoplasma suis]CBZ40832.1 hypothetical protein MSUIS_07390 [Mycoplasma suis KI3806]